MELVLGYAAGLLTLINPCVLPILPIVLATALQAGRSGPVAVAAGMSVSFVALGLFVALAGRSFGLSEQTIADAGAVLMIVFGAVLLVPRFSAAFATASAGISTQADFGIEQADTTNVKGQFLGGLLLGAVWSPCIGPTLGGAIALASQGESLMRATAIMASFALGVSTIILALSYGAQSVIRRRQNLMRRIANVSRPIMGTMFIAVGLAILFRLHHLAEIWALENLPYWLTDLSVSI